jgi:ribonuclease HI
MVRGGGYPAKEQTTMTTSGSKVTIYTDGACQGNPDGPGGFAAIIVTPEGKRRIAGGRRSTTNNRMEMMAAIEGLAALEGPMRAVVYSDSAYLVNGMRLGWAERWRARGWMRDKKHPAKNPDLWERLLRLASIHGAEFRHVRGHSGDPLNEECDRLATAQCVRTDLPPDEIHERNKLRTASRALPFG